MFSWPRRLSCGASCPPPPAAQACFAFALLGAVAAAACSGPPPPPPPGTFDLELRQPHQNGNLFFGRNAGGAGNPAWGASDLPNVVLDPFGREQFVAVRFRSPDGRVEVFPQTVLDDIPGSSTQNQLVPLAVGEPVDLHVFIRDPDEYFNTLLATSGSWRGEISSARGYPTGEASWPLLPFALPNGLIMPYLGNPPAQNIVDPTLLSYFWVDNTTGFSVPRYEWGSPGIDPVARGSIKGLHVLHHGACERSFPLQDVVNQVKSRLPRGLASQCGTIFSVTPLFVDVSVDRASSTEFAATSYLRADTSSPFAGAAASAGGFLIDGGAAYSLSGHLAFVPFAAGCTGDYRYQYEPQLVDENGQPVAADGFFHLAPTKHSLKMAGPIGALCDALQGQLKDNLEGALPAVFDAQALDLMSIDIAARDPDHAADYDCEPGFSGGAPTPANCTGAATRFQVAVLSGAQNLLGMLQPAVSSALFKTATNGASSAPAANGPVRPAGNWACINRPDPPATTCGKPRDHFRCHFVLRAKHVVVEPDAVTVRWFDRIDEYTRPGLALFFASFYTQSGSAKRSQFPWDLCGRSPWTVQGFDERWFATAWDDWRTCNKDALGDGPVGRRGDRCCVADANCAVRTGAFCAGNRCRGGACSQQLPCLSGADFCDNGACVPRSGKCDIGDPFTCGPGAVCEDAGYGPECRTY